MNFRRRWRGGRGQTEPIRPTTARDALSMADLEPGQSGEIIDVLAVGVIRNRLHDLGFRRGKIVQLVRRAPLRDPLEFRIDYGHISLRRADAALIKVKQVS